MFVDQREPGKSVVEIIYVPIIGCMATLAIRAESTGVGVILQVTTDALRLGSLQRFDGLRSSVAAAAFQSGVCAAECKTNLGVIEVGAKSIDAVVAVKAAGTKIEQVGGEEITVDFQMTLTAYTHAERAQALGVTVLTFEGRAIT